MVCHFKVSGGRYLGQARDRRQVGFPARRYTHCFSALLADRWTEALLFLRGTAVEPLAVYALCLGTFSISRLSATMVVSP
jgi:hypothetical protein